MVSLCSMNNGWRRFVKTWLWISFDFFQKNFFPKFELLNSGCSYLGVWLICGFLLYSCFHSYFSDEFENVIKKTTFFSKIKFNFDTEFVKTYFGVNKKACIRFDDFSHLLQVSKLCFSNSPVVHIWIFSLQHPALI